MVGFLIFIVDKLFFKVYSYKYIMHIYA